MESTKAKASNIITPLKGKVLHYAQLCKQKVRTHSVQVINIDSFLVNHSTSSDMVSPS